jgi:hypothetical protein
MQTKSCYKCGTKNTLKARKCFNCGARLTGGGNLLYILRIVLILGAGFLASKCVIGH